MEQKDKTTPAEAPLKKLASAQDLRGSKSGTGKEGNGGKRNLWVPIVALVVVLGAACGIYFASNNIKPAEPAPTEAPAYQSTTVKLVERQRSEVASIGITLPDGESYTIVNQNKYEEDGTRIPLAQGEKGYAIEGLEEFDLNQSTAETIVGYAADLTATQLITDNAENLADFGLDAPRAEIAMNYRDGKTTTWLIGSQAPTNSGSYFAEKGKNAVFLIYSSAVKNLTGMPLAHASMPVAIAMCVLPHPTSP